ncbi:MAG: A/G-specific adenine glycosylase [Verrucomicrobiales bacterium]
MMTRLLKLSTIWFDKGHWFFDHGADLKTEFAPEAISALVLGWYAAHARDLPWRRTTDPYAVWVSEIMLQQTQVKTVIPYWERWMRELPTIQSLAEADLEKVLKLWEGLGYYRRARAMRQAAIWLVENNGGAFPSTHAEILNLPGIGPYTAGAICSIAYNQPTPIVDGNITRLISRLERIQKPVDDSKVKALIWKRSGALVAAAARQGQDTGARNCSALNQGLMEIGATICIPGKPLCLLCPIQTHCKAFKKGDQERYPQLPERVSYTRRNFIAFIIERDGRFLVRKREEKALNAGLWEFPNWEVLNDSEKESLLQKAGLPGSAAPFRKIKHTITRYRITLEIFKAPSAGNSIWDASSTESSWMTLEQLQIVPFSSAHAKIREFLK